jgi:hypothetical protein
MNITDIFNNRNPKKLNEAIETVFGKKLDLEAFTIEQLEDSRNRLRTQIYTVRNSSGFNETVENDSYTKAQWMLDAINAEVMQRESEAPVEVEEGAMSEIAIELSQVADDEDYDKLYDLLSDDGPIGDYLQDKIQDITGETGLHAKDDFEEIEKMLMDIVQREFGGQNDENDFDPLKHVDNPTQGEKDAAPDVNRGSYSDRAAMLRSAEADGRLKDNINNGEDMTQVRESATDKASAVVTAKTMVDRVGRWIEELAGMENDTLLSLGDTIRDEMGQDQAKAFLSNVAPAIQQALQNLKATRETLATGVRGLTGEEQSAELIGSETPDMGTDMAGDMGAGDEIAPAGPDEMNTGEEAPADEFGASEPAVGGMETAGRAQRESIDRSSQLLRVLAG